MKRRINVKKSQIFVLLFLLAVFILSAPHIIRIFNYSSILMGDEPHYHARIAQQIIDKGVPVRDDFVYGGREYIANPYHFILAGLSVLFSAATASKIIPFICGLLSVLIFYFILRTLGFKTLNMITISIVFLLSPAFIYAFTLSTPLCVIVLLDLLGFYIFIQKKQKFFALSVAVFLIASFFGLSNLLFILLATFSYTLVYKKRKKNFYILMFFLALVFFFYYTNVYFEAGIQSLIRPAEADPIRQFTTDLGGAFGFSIFALLLSVLGFVIAWGSKKSLYYIYLIMLFVVLYSFFYNYAVIYSNFAVSVFAGIAITYFIRKKWVLKIIRNLSIALLFCGLLFSAISYTVRSSNQQPHTELIEALAWIKNNSGEGEIVFSHYTNGFLTEFYAQRPVVMDSLSAHSINFADVLEDSSTIFDSWDIKETRRLLTKYNVSFILITRNMYEGLVWDNPEQGLAYLLRNSKTFKKEYSNNYAGVWRYIYHEN